MSNHTVTLDWKLISYISYICKYASLVLQLLLYLLNLKVFANSRRVCQICCILKNVYHEKSFRKEKRI